MDCLGAGGEAAQVGDGQAEIFVGVDWGIVDADFVVEMGAGGASAEADVADGVAAVDVLSGGDGEAGEMSVTGGDAVAVIDHDSATVSAEEVGEGDGAVGGGDDGGSDNGGNIDAGVECAFSVKWIDAFAEGAGDLAFDGPEVGSGVGAGPVGGGGIFCEAERDAYAGCAGEGCALRA